jgi:hypothetical protein
MLNLFHYLSDERFVALNLVVLRSSREILNYFASKQTPFGCIVRQDVETVHFIKETVLIF